MLFKRFNKLCGFLLFLFFYIEYIVRTKLTGNNILENAGKVSDQKALDKAHTEHEKYKEQIKNELSNIEKDFIKQIDTTTKKV